MHSISTFKRAPIWTSWPTPAATRQVPAAAGAQVEQRCRRHGGNRRHRGPGGSGGASNAGQSPDTETQPIDTSGRAMLLKLPGMTIEIADAILDWIDDDDEPREYGAEIDFYSTLTPPYSPQNGPLKTIEELLLVRGITPDMLFGRDINRNGMIDVQEMDLPLVINGDPETGRWTWAGRLT